MNDVLNIGKDILIQVLGGAVSTAIIGFIISLIKKGQFRTWGVVAGKWLSKIGNSKIGKNTWEKFEDIITISLVSFVQGLKEGADADDIKTEKSKDELNKDAEQQK